ncbi:hypothetical protein [Streptomyces sp. NPDC058613]|uniref:hypothetical protein n=1 Tax=Streptomyces sp. NPDC058613 TaxID=3346556 RepID=UPI0036515FA8
MDHHDSVQPPPIDLPDHDWQIPIPSPGCEICTEASARRRRAHTSGDLSAVTDHNITLRGHPHNRARAPH